MSWLGDLGSAVFGALYAGRVPAAIAGIVLLVILAVVARRRGWFGAARRHPRLAAMIGVPTLAIALPLGWYLASPLVLTSTVDEPAPVAVTSPAPTASSAPAVSAPPSVTPSAGSLASSAPPPTTRPGLALRGTFTGSDDFHFGRGTARLIETAPGEYVVRLEDFAVRNGPDLYIYLSPSADGYTKDAIELGRLKADRGNQNYAVPAGALDDLARAASVVIWCKQFSHLFATAPLASA